MQIRIIESNQFGNLDPADLERFEQSLGCALPEHYRQFLLEHNGGNVDGAPQIAEMNCFYGIHDGPDWSRFPNLAQLRSGGFPNDLLPIADDPFGNFIGIVLSGPNRGTACFWDHECGPDPADGISILTPDFDAYLRGVAIKVALHRRQSQIIRQAATEVGDGPVYAGQSILDLAFELADFPIIEMLVSTGGRIRPDALIEAVRNDAMDTIRFLLDRGMYVNYVIPETGFTALMLAGSGQRLDIMELLVAHGADTTLRNRWGKTAADLAAGNWQGEFH